MRKFLLFFSLLIFGLTYSRADVWKLGGDFNEWNVETALEMTEQSDGTFTITMPSLKGLFKFVQNGWLENNVGALCYPDITGNCTVSTKKDGLPFNAPEELTDVTITFDPATSKASFSGLPKDIDVTQPFIKEEGCFILGYQTGAIVPNEGVSMAEVAPGIFETTLSFTASTPIKFSTAIIGIPDTDDGTQKAWEKMADYIISPVQASQQESYVLPVGEVIKMAFPGTTAATCNLPADGRYTLTMNTTEKTLLVNEATIPVYICGDISSLDGTNNNFAEPSLANMSFYDTYFRLQQVSKGVYKGTFYINGEKWGNKPDPENVDTWPGLRFYTDLTGWYSDALGAAEWDFTYIPTEWGKNYPMIEKGMGLWAFYVEERTQVFVTVDLNTLNVTFDTTDTAVEEIGQEDNSPEIWYNLQGVRVDKPQKGIYIRVRNNKTEKVRL
ncbi:MAG: hypothetical protein K2J48_08450 [Muribaculaceae bacterium]|nr:hypothetical protein [Muribaculaceae bacterium]